MNWTFFRADINVPAPRFPAQTLADAITYFSRTLQCAVARPRRALPRSLIWESVLGIQLPESSAPGFRPIRTGESDPAGWPAPGWARRSRSSPRAGALECARECVTV